MRTIDRTRLQFLMQREQQKFVADRPVRRVIIVPGKLVNVVV